MFILRILWNTNGAKLGVFNVQRQGKEKRDKCFFWGGATAPRGSGPTIIEASRPHSDTPHSVGLLWTSDHSDVETSTWQHTHHSLQTEINDPGGIRTRNPSERVAVRFRLPGQYDRQLNVYKHNNEFNDKFDNPRLQISVLGDLKRYCNVGRYGR